MLSVILTILKIIGIILLVVLGLLLTVALIVLFVPIRYMSTGDFKKTDDGIKDNIFFKVTWLLHIVSVTFKLKDTDSELVIKIFGKELNLGTKADERPNNVSEHKTKDTKNTKVITVRTVTTKNDDARENSENQKNPEKAQKSATVENVRDKKNDKKEHITDADGKEKKTFKEKISDIWNKIDLICQKIKNIKDIKDSFVEYLKRDESKLAIREIKHIVFKVLKHILPRKLWARIKFGFDDPSTTGNILGVASVFYGVYGDKLELEPDFENASLEGEYRLKGRIRVFTLLVAAFKIYRNKWLKEFIAFSKKTVKKFDKKQKV